MSDESSWIRFFGRNDLDNKKDATHRKKEKQIEITTSVLTCITVQFLSLCVAFLNLQSVLNDMVAAFSYLHPKKIEVLCIMVLHELV